MPIEKCTANGKSGYRWGKSGKCYTGPGARQKALKQGRAVEINKSKGSGSRMIQLLTRIEEVLAAKDK